MMAANLPLAGTKAVSLASLGPGPYAAMLLADLGCDVTIVDRTGYLQTSMAQDQDPRRRGQKSIALDLKSEAGRAILDELIGGADILLEGMRPGVAEKLGLSPERCHQLNARLVYARITGWGQDGPLAQRAGHDINYIALSGALLAMGDSNEPPPVPLNLLGDYAGGGMYVALGIVAALFQAQRTGCGTVIDAAMIDGVASLATAPMGIFNAGLWGPRGTNVLDGGAPYYRTYTTRDGGYMAVGAIEPQFYAQLLATLGLNGPDWPQNDRTVWPALAEKLASTFRSEDRATWEARFAGSDACVTPVLSFSEAPSHPHHQARGTYVGHDGAWQPAPGPRYSGVAFPAPLPPPGIGADTDAILHALGRNAEQIEELRSLGAVA